MARLATIEEIYDNEFVEYGSIDAIAEFSKLPSDDRLLPELEDEDGLSGEELLRLLGEGEPEAGRWH